MALPPNPQRVALSTDAQGKPSYITREWLRFFEVATGTAATGGGTTDLTALLAAIAALTARVQTLEQEVEGLRIGYHV